MNRVVADALAAGYRSFDTASFYNNEAGLGLAISRSGIKRKQLFITSKLWNDEQGYGNTITACQKSIERQQTSYIDLYLVHWPIKRMLDETWRAMQELLKKGYVKAIGVSNFNINHLQQLAANHILKPAVNQIELHPLLYQSNIIEYCQKHNIAIEAWRPLAMGQLLTNSSIMIIAEKYHKKPSQIILRWHLQNSFIIIPKSIHADRIRENAAIFDFELSPGDMQTITDLNCNQRFGPDPAQFSENL